MRNIMLVVMCLTGCNTQPEVGQQTWECPVEVEPSSLGVEIEGGPVQFGSVTGTIVERAASGRQVEQLLFDPLQDRVLAIEGGDIVAYGESLRKPQTLASAPAGAWLLASPRGVIVFDPEMGWHLLEAENIAPQVPVPIAAWFDGELHALVPNETGVDWLVSDSHLGAPVLRVALEAGPRVRAVRAAMLSGAVIADEDESGVRLRLVDESGLVHGELELALGSIVDLLSLGAAARTERVALLVADPPTLVVADLAGRRRGYSTLPLDADPAPAHALVWADRLLVATVEGVVAVTLEDGLRLDRGFEGEDLRAPLAGPVGRRTF
jgi:hypothetical protein